MASKVPMHLSPLADAGKCTVCQEDGRPDKQADVWCVQCQKSMCSACLSYHSRYKWSHVTTAVQEMKNFSGVHQADSNQCSEHGRQLEYLCFDCSLAKCTDCIRQCESLGHAAPRQLNGSEDLGRVMAEVLTAKAEAESNTSTAQRQQVNFGPASSSFQLPVDYRDLSVTPEGHVLVAAGWKGMRELDLSGCELSSWKPHAWANGNDDFVSTVAALDDGRAAVGLSHSQLLVLLQRTSSDRTWLVERRVAELQSDPIQLSVLGDVAAVNMDRGRLQLVRLSSGQSLYSENTGYDIYSVTLTAAGVVTVSFDRVKLSDDRRMYVVDCISHRGERLWRHELSDEDWWRGVCAAPGGLLYYVCLWGRSVDGSNDCIMAIDRQDGKKVDDVLVTSSLGIEQPWSLSLSRGQLQQQVLVVLSMHEYNRPGLWVTVHPAVSSRGSETPE